MIIPSIFLLIFISSSSSSAHQIEVEALLNFKKSLSNASATLQSWNATLSPPCNRDDFVWTGLQCDRGSVEKLILDGIGLSGIIDVDSLANLPSLRTFSIMANNFDGPIPDFTKLPLKNLYLSGNRFSGSIPDDAFRGMNSLNEIYLANNRFVGPIPESILGLKKLTELSLERNQFTGSIPDFQQQFTVINVSGNQLVGPVPESL